MYNDSDTAAIDANLDLDTLKHQRKVEKSFVFFLIFLIIIFKGWFSFWFKYGIAIPNGKANSINITQDPIQINYSPEEKKQKTFVHNSFINKNKITIIPQAHYELSGTAVAFNRSFLFTYNFFDSAALYDLGTAWGKMGDKNFYKKHYKSYSQKNEVTGSRILWTQAKDYPPALPMEYSTSHYSHSHLVPANRNVMAALLKIRRWDRIKITGDLIDMQFKGQKYNTSMSRNDHDLGDRGNGSCETIYVKSVQIGKKVYK